MHWISRSLPKGVIHARTAAIARRPVCRRRLHDRHVRAQRVGRDGGATAVRHQADRGSRVRARAAARDDRRRCGRVPAVARRHVDPRAASCAECRASGMRRMSSRRGRTCASSWCRGSFPRSVSRCFRIRRRCCRSSSARRASRGARARRPDARVRGPADGAEVARRRARRGRRERRRDVPCRRRRRPAGAARGACRARVRPRRPAARTGARGLLHGRRLAAVFGVGELPAHGGRGARRRDAGHRDRGRRRAEVVVDGENGCSFRGRPGCARRRDPPFFSDEALRKRLRGAAASSVERYAPERILEQLELVLAEAARR